MSLKLTYFNIAGRAQTSRACFLIGGVAFEDHKIGFPEFKSTREASEGKVLYPLSQVPVLTLPSGKVITQSGAIARYAAKLAKLYPTDAEEALLVDEIVETINDINSAPQSTDPEVKKKLREEWAAGKLKRIFDFLATKLPADGKAFLVGGKLSLADIALYGNLQSLRTGNLDYVPTTYASDWPSMAGFIAFLEADAKFGPQAAGFKPAPPS